MTEFRLYNSRGKALRLMLMCAALVGLGCSLIPHWVSGVLIALFGLGFPVSILRLLDRRPQIIVNEVGVFSRATHPEFINWEIIRDSYLATIYRQQAICLVVDEAFEPSRTKGKFRQGLVKLNQMLGFQELNIPLANVDVDGIRFAELILAMRSAEPSERERLVKHAIANL
ncbi:hypothetical protein IC235_20835 [Hymenobacter sp. BT664]|uniref:Uncharacterized protein n=1 Tax=Hymenobacter montanus TaxID=2771359 RepID=A0A927BH36_9BACT|nr:STM3941 family protein [Hymenobacter montanus]MBD2770341.1 hypothetical protein [Hymenobacter montanus]